MKISLLLPATLLGLASCMSPNFSRIVPENKDADVHIIYPYGQITIRSRVNPHGYNALLPLDNTKPVSQ